MPATAILAELNANKEDSMRVAKSLGAETSRIRKLSEARRGNNSKPYNERELDKVYALTVEASVGRAKASLVRVTQGS
jgi:hypothetical protein